MEFYAGRTECKVCKKAIAARNKRVRKLRDPAYVEYVRQKCRDWKASNKDKVRTWKAAWRASPAGRISKRLRERSESPVGRGVVRHCRELLARQKWRCAVCRTDLRVGKHLDHIFPLAAGGKSEIGNLQWLCPPCNLAKAAKLPHVFMQERGMLL